MLLLDGFDPSWYSVTSAVVDWQMVAISRYGVRLAGNGRHSDRWRALLASGTRLDIENDPAPDSDEVAALVAKVCFPTVPYSVAGLRTCFPVLVFPRDATPGAWRGACR